MFRTIARLVPALIIAATLAYPAAAADQKEIEDIIRTYIETHPEVIDSSLRNFYQQKKKKQEEAQFQQSLKKRVDVPLDGSPIKGSPDAPVTLVEFSDFQCPFCARSAPLMRRLEKKYGGKLRFAFKHFPLERIHSVARDAAKASMAAGEQGKFWEYHDLLMEKQAEWGRGDKEKLFTSYAKKVGVDTERFTKDSATPDYDTRINADLKLGKKLGVQATPTFFINGVMVRGARDMNYFSRVIDRLLEEKSGAKN